MYYESDAILLLLKKHFSYIFFSKSQLKSSKTAWNISFEQKHTQQKLFKKSFPNNTNRQKCSFYKK